MTCQADSSSAGLRGRVIGLAIALPLTLTLAGCAVAVPQSDESPAVAYRNLGEAYLRQGNLPRATAALDRAVSLDPDDAAALQALALIHQRQGEAALADEFFRRALDEDPNFTRARNNYAAFLYDRGQTGEACEQLEQASHDIHYAHRAQLFANLGRCRWELGEVETARAALERSQRIDSSLPASHLTLAELEYAQGNLMRARSQLDRFVSQAGWTTAARQLAASLGDADTGARTSAEPDQPSRAL
ncbi:MAG: type IV pilus biogenesis/stability protein PilW [Gammaproteobacteria bacterium]|uniref:type IV pilus biogenesis/stability protein PilW n=1 Tax=Halomonas sp. EF61 TaxID=2950869 RepID=UPI0032DE33F9|nr:type IV pilus biogenesis/stability protein PilW [Gammaproteobacteria bacterium]